MQSYSFIIPSELLCCIAKYNVKTLLNMIMVNKEMNHLATQNHFWYEIYQHYNIPININKYKFGLNYILNTFIYSYNSLLLTNCLLEEYMIEFELDYDYNGTQKIVDKLQEMNITCDELKEVLLYANPECIIDNNDNRYDLHMNIYYNHNEYREGFVQLHYFATFTKEQLFEFLYHFIDSECFITKSRYSFHKSSYQDYKQIFNIDFITK